MERIEDITAKDWIANNISLENAARPLLLSNFLPPIFDNYIAVLGTPGLIDNFPFDKIKQPSNTIEQINTNVEIWKQFKIYTHDSSDDFYRPTTYAELSSIFNLQYDIDVIKFLPWKTQGIKTLISETTQRLDRIVSALSIGEELNIFMEDYWRFLALDELFPYSENAAYKLSQNEYFDLMKRTGYDSTMYLYPTNKSWCLVNIEDLEYNILAFKNTVSDNFNNLSLKDTFRLKYNDIIFL